MIHIPLVIYETPYLYIYIYLLNCILKDAILTVYFITNHTVQNASYALTQKRIEI
jgi:hypothetical protein